MSTIRQFPNTELIKDEAAVWVAKIYGQTYKADQDIPEEVLAELEAWLSQSSLHREVFFTTMGSWDAIGMLGELAEIMPLSELQRRNGLSMHFQRWLKGFANVAWSKFGFVFSGSALVGIALFFWLVVDATPQQFEHITGIGEQQRFSLSDGSRLTLNTDSKVTVDFGGERRVIRLEKGEANFEVSKDSNWPFVVYAGDGMVWAVGTAFNVNYRGDHVDVIVSEGRVKVFSGASLSGSEPLLSVDGANVFPELNGENSDISNPLQEVLLDAGEAAQYSQQQISKEPIEAQRFIKELAWQEGALVFRGETLEQALIEVSRYTDRPLIIVDPSIRNASVGGRYKVDDIEVLIDSLTLGLGIQTEYSSEGSILFSAKLDEATQEILEDG